MECKKGYHKQHIFIFKINSRTNKNIFSDLVKLKDEMDPYTTIDLIDRHEKECGIPDDIFTVLNTLEERRANVILKNAGLNISTLQEFRNLSSLLGYSLSIDSASSIRFPPYDVPFYPLPVGGCYFLIVIRGNISIVNISYFVNFMEKLLPANCGLLLIDTSV